MVKIKAKQVIPYIGIPIISITFLLFQLNRLDIFYILQYLLLIIFGYIATVSDIKSKEIKNSLIIAMFAGWIVTIVPRLFINIEGTLTLLTRSLLGFAIGGGLFLLVYIISRKGLGGGDVKFMAIAGLYLGLDGIIPTLLYGSVLAALVGWFLVLLKRINRKDSIPLAPFLFIGILINIFLM